MPTDPQALDMTGARPASENRQAHYTPDGQAPTVGARGAAHVEQLRAERARLEQRLRQLDEQIRLAG